MGQHAGGTSRANGSRRPVAAALKHVSRQQADGYRELFTNARSLAVNTAHGAATLTIGAAPYRTGENWVGLAGDTGEARLQLARDSLCVPLGQRSWQDYDGEARLLAWSLAHDALLGFLEEALGQGLKPAALYETPMPAHDERNLFSFSLRQASNVRAVSGVLDLPTAWLEEFLQRASVTSVTPAQSRLRDMPLTLDLYHYGPALALERLRGIRAGDVVVLGARQHVLNHLLLMADDHNPAWCCRSETDRLIVTHLAPGCAKETEAMTAIEKSTAPDAGGAALVNGHQQRIEALPITLEVGLGEVTLSLEALTNLQPGYVLGLQTPVEGTNVTLHANRQLVGRGELIVAGDKLGVCVTSWGSDGL